MFIIFMLGVYLGFIYTLSMLTEATQLNFYTDFLDESVLTYVNQTQAVNQEVFRLSLGLVAVTTVMYGFGFGKKVLNIFKAIVSVLIGILAVVFNVIGYLRLTELNQLYRVTNTSWPETINDVFGYEEPANLFIGNGPLIYMVQIIIAALFVGIMATVLIVQLKEKKNEKTT